MNDNNKNEKELEKNSESEEERIRRIESRINFELLKDLSEINGCSGHEEKIREYIKNKIKLYCDEIRTDSIGNLYAIKYGKNKNKSILLISHMDEIGFIIRYIDKDGYLRVSPIGGQNLRILPGSRVIISTQKGDIYGVFGEKPIHLIKQKDRDRVSEIEELFLDIGALSKEEAEKKVSIGDYAEFDQKMIRFSNSTIVSGKSFDDRIGCYILINILKELKNVNLENTIITCFSTQEEVGIRGAAIVGNNINPTSALVVEVTHSVDFPGINSEDYSEIKLRKGPSISIGPNLHPKITRILIDIAKKEKIKYQIEPEPAPTGTDARIIQITGKGIPVGLVSVPLRYMHTSIETIDLDDVVSTIELIKKYIENSNIDDYNL